MVACTCTPSKEQYGGMGQHATKRTLWWRGTTTVPPTFGVMVMGFTTPLLHRELWYELGGMVNPRQQR
jgi:hypothetical protein